MESDRLDDFVGLEYCVRNIGNDELRQVYLGFFADPTSAIESPPPPITMISWTWSRSCTASASLLERARAPPHGRRL